MFKKGILEFGISIHALREESDTKFGKDKSDDFIISIHALREESDSNNPIQGG